MKSKVSLKFNSMKQETEVTNLLVHRYVESVTYSSCFTCLAADFNIKPVPFCQLEENFLKHKTKFCKKKREGRF